MVERYDTERPGSRRTSDEPRAIENGILRDTVYHLQNYAAHIVLDVTEDIAYLDKHANSDWEVTQGEDGEYHGIFMAQWGDGDVQDRKVHSLSKTACIKALRFRLQSRLGSPVGILLRQLSKARKNWEQGK